MATRSAVLARAVTAGPVSGSLVAQVQSTDTWILKSIVASNLNAAAQTIAVFVGNAAGTIIAVLLNQNVGSGQSASWSGWVALGPTDEIFWTTGASGAHLWVSGADLQGHV